jgi:hypothetical protein
MLDEFDNEYDEVTELAIRLEKARKEFKGSYKLNMEKHQRFVEIYNYFIKFAKENGGTVELVDADTSWLSEDVEAIVPLLDVYGEKLSELLAVLSKADVLAINPTTNDSISIGVSVSDVWERVPDVR